MKVAITGVSGYLGSLLARALDRDPDVESISGFDVTAPGFELPKLKFKKADVRTTEFSSLFEGADAVYHLAFIVEPPKSMTMAEIDGINIGGSRRVFEGVIAAGVPKLIYSSSIAAYGMHKDNPELFTEDHPLRPNEDFYYSRTKGKVEAILDGFQKANPGIKVIRFRPSIFLGPTVNNALGRGLRAGKLVCLNRKVRVDLCWDADIVDAFRLALDYDRSDIFNLTGGAPLTWDEMGKLAGKKVIHLNPRYVVPLLRLGAALGRVPDGMVEWARVGMAGPIIVSADRAKERLGWKPRFDSAGTFLEYLKCRETGDVKREM